jgi:hypothetical protein
VVMDSIALILWMLVVVLAELVVFPGKAPSYTWDRASTTLLSSLDTQWSYCTWRGILAISVSIGKGHIACQNFGVFSDQCIHKLGCQLSQIATSSKYK